MGRTSLGVGVSAAMAAGPVGTRQTRRSHVLAARGWGRWLADPRSAVLLVLASAVLAGGGRKLLQAWRARGAIARLSDPAVSAAEVEAVARHGRAGLMDLFRILGTAEPEAVRDAAGRALAVLWARDDLVPEEEKALLRRGYAVCWRARRRYPRTLHTPIPIAVSYGVPFLREGVGVGPENLEWSHQVLGARRAGLEGFTPWTRGAGHAEFTLVPEDFDTEGPHRLALQARVRTVGLTDPWTLELPFMPFHIEFDPRLVLESITTMPDVARGESIAAVVRLEPTTADEARPAGFLSLSEDLVLRAPPSLAVTLPLPCDLAHAIAVEFEDIPGRWEAGAVVLGGQGTGREEPASIRRFAIGPIAPIPVGLIARPGPRRLRAVLTADVERGWADPDVRSIWPGTIVTEWNEVQIVRR